MAIIAEKTTLDMENNEVVDVRGFNSQIDLPGCVNMFSKDFDLPEEDVKNFLLSINASERTIAHLVLEKEKIIVAHGAVTRDPTDSTKGWLNAIHATETTYLKAILGELITNCKNNDIDILYMEFTHLDNDSPLITPYKALGFTYTGTSMKYKKEIE